MSRNIRNKFPRPPAKITKRRGSDSSSSQNLLDDDGYSALEDISDSEDNEEEDVDAAEERHIITHERLGSSSRSPRPRIGDAKNGNDESEDDDEDADADSELSASAVDEDEDDDSDDTVNHEAADDSSPGSTPSWNGIASESEGSGQSSRLQPAPQLKRHVRFDVPYSDSDSTETEDDPTDLFPDLFVDQNSLDPTFRREIEHDEDDSSTSSAYWDQYNFSYVGQRPGDMTRLLGDLGDPAEMRTLKAVLASSQEASPTENVTPVAFASSPQELDGYESDGETTEEDEPEPPIRRGSMDVDRAMESSSTENAKKGRFRPGKPRLGSFDLDSSVLKPIAVVNPISRKMMIFTPYRRDQLDLSPESFNVDFWSAASEQPILSNSGGLMMGAMVSSHTFGDFVNSQVGPEEAFFPYASSVFAEFSSSDDLGSDQGVDEAEHQLNVDDFLILENDDSSDEDANGEFDIHGAASSPDQAASRRSSDGDLVSHLTSETVSAFRRNQLHQKLINSNQATADSLTFSSPYNLTALRGLKTDHFATAAVPLAPPRRPKQRKSFDMPNPSESPSQKRKASGEDHLAHKRQRSISDVNMLRI